jgi:hypothetical protein
LNLPVITHVKSNEQSPVKYLVGGLEHFFVAYILHFGPNVKYYSPFLLVIFSIRWFGTFPNVKLNHTRWCPPVLSWFIIPLTIDISPTKTIEKLELFAPT